MISKKKVTALALAGLFVTPVLAATEVDYNEIRSGDGYLTADDNLFSEALENSLNRTDSSKNAVKLSMYGKYDDTSNDGLTELKLSSGKTYDNVNCPAKPTTTSTTSCSPTTPGRTTPFIAQVSVLMRRL